MYIWNCSTLLNEAIVKVKVVKNCKCFVLPLIKTFYFVRVFCQKILNIQSDTKIIPTQTRVYRVNKNTLFLIVLSTKTFQSYKKYNLKVPENSHFNVKEIPTFFPNPTKKIAQIMKLHRKWMKISTDKNNNTFLKHNLIYKTLRSLSCFKLVTLYTDERTEQQSFC